MRVGRGVVLSGLVWLGTIAAAIAQSVPPSSDGGQIPQGFMRSPGPHVLPDTGGTALQPFPDDRFVFARSAPFQREQGDLPPPQTPPARRMELISSRTVKTVAPSTVGTVRHNFNGEAPVGENAAATARAANQPEFQSQPPNWTMRSSLGSNPENKLGLGGKKRSKPAAERADSQSTRGRKPVQGVQTPRSQSSGFDGVRHLMCRWFSSSSCHARDPRERAAPAVARTSLPQRAGRQKKPRAEVRPGSSPARPRWRDARVATTPRAR
jgi:hypothetical protein